MTSPPPAPLLVVDLGNTRAKWALFAAAPAPAPGAGPASLPQPLQAGAWPYGSTPQLPTPAPSHWALANVHRADHALVAALTQALGPPALSLSAATPSALTLAYQTPHTLGADRYLAAVAAHHASASPAQPQAALAIDLGTAITFDAVSAAGAYLGGAIAPGLHLRYQALHAHTARLPLIEAPAPALPSLVGATTEGSLRAGVERALVTEVAATLAAYRLQLGPRLPVFVTGGDGPWLLSHLPAVAAQLGLENPPESPTFACPSLVLQGAALLLLSHRLGPS